TLGEEAIRTQADAAGRWDVVFSPRPASGEPLTLRVTAGDDTIELADVLIGDVWLCAGQSNMNRSLAESLEADAVEAARAAGDPLVRYLVVPERGHRQP